MTPFSKSKLLAAERQYYSTTYPSVPAIGLARTAYKDNSSNSLTRCIIDYIRFTGGYAERINTMGRQIKAKSGRDIWIRGGGSNGSSDISAVLPGGRSARIEVKYGRDQIRPNQIRYAEKVTRAGALYFIARDFDSFLNWYDANKVINIANIDDK